MSLGLSFLLLLLVVARIFHKLDQTLQLGILCELSRNLLLQIFCLRDKLLHFRGKFSLLAVRLIF